MGVAGEHLRGNLVLVEYIIGGRLALFKIGGEVGSQRTDSTTYINMHSIRRMYCYKNPQNPQKIKTIILSVSLYIAICENAGG